MYHVFFDLSIEKLSFSKLFFVKVEKTIDFSELLVYYVGKGGEKMEYNKVASCADRLKLALTIRGMRQSDLCRLTQIPKSAISQYISGAFEPKQDRIYLISKALNVNETWLMGLDVPMERPKAPTLDLQLFAEKNPTAISDGLTGNRKKLVDYAITLSEEQADRALQVLKLIVEGR